jgi:hypothetical protein
LVAYSCAPASNKISARPVDKFNAPLLAVNYVRNLPAHDLIAKLDLLPLVQPVEHRTAQFLNALQRHEIFFLHVEQLVKINIVLVVRIPEMIVSCKDNLAEIM